MCTTTRIEKRVASAVSESLRLALVQILPGGAGQLLRHRGRALAAVPGRGSASSPAAYGARARDQGDAAAGAGRHLPLQGPHHYARHICLFPASFPLSHLSVPASLASRRTGCD